jgi:hypothetical protein
MKAIVLDVLQVERKWNTRSGCSAGRRKMETLALDDMQVERKWRHSLWMICR